MSKRKKTQISGNKELSISKTKKSLRKKAHLTTENDLETLTQTFQTRKYPSIVSLNQKDKENVVADQDISSAKESELVSCEWKELDHTKILLPASQNGKLVPKFTNTKKTLRKIEETATIWKNEVQHTDRNITNKPDNINNKPENSIQNTDSSSKPTEMMDLPVINTESAGDHNVWQDVNMHNQNEIVMINNSEANTALSGSYKETEIELNSQESYCEKKMSQEQVSFFSCMSSNNNVNFSEKTEVSIEPLKSQLFKQMNEGMLAEDRITDYTKTSQDEKECLGCLDKQAQQIQSMQVILKSDETDYCSWTKDACSLERMSSQTKKENRVTELPEVTSGKSNSYVCTESAGEQSSADTKKIVWSLSDKSRIFGEQINDCTCSSTGICELDCCKYRVTEKATDQHNLETNGKSVEKGIRGTDIKQNNICRREAIISEETYIKDQDISEKDFAYVRPVCPYFEKGVDNSEPICEQVSPSFPRCDEEVLSESKNILMQDNVSRKESICTSAETNVPSIFIQQQQNKSCSQNFVSNTQQSKSDKNNMSTNVIEALSSKNIAEEKMIKISKAEISDKYIADEKLAQYEESKEVDNVESSLCNAQVPLTKVVSGNSCKDINADSKIQNSFTACSMDSSVSASCDFRMVAHICSSYPDPFPLDLEFLPESQLQNILESHSLELQSQKTCFLNNLLKYSEDKTNQYAATKQAENKTLSPGSTKINGRDEKERTCDQSTQEDATDIVCGLIKELSNLNRLIMSTHRDLDSFKRMKFRRNRQHGKLLLHSTNMTSTFCTVKKREL